MKAQKMKYTKPTQRQLELKESCLASAKENWGDGFEVRILLEIVYEFNGILSFVLQKKAKPNTGMLFLCDKSIHIQIGRRGGVKTKLSGQDGDYKSNKHCIII